MKRNFTHEIFESFLRQNADHLRMRPADRVWENLTKRLESGRRKYTISLFTFFLAISLFGYQLTQDTTALFTIPAGIDDNKAVTANESIRQTSSGRFIANVQRNISQRPVTSISETLLFHQKPLEFDFGNNLISEQSFTLLTGSRFESIIDNDVNPVPVPENQVTENTVNTDPLTIENVTNSYIPSKKPTKVGIQLFFTPTVSYRKLSENKSYLRFAQGNVPYTYPSLYNVNNIVTHKPDIGFELGIAARYGISKKFKVRGGLQFNVNRYDIKTFTSTAEIATIRLNNRSGGQSSVNTITNYNNFNGYRTNWLQNFYFQVSSPVGIEFKIKGDEKMQFGIATTVQPTFVLGDRAYLISADYKNYMEVPWLIRRWNVNTNLETFVSYSTGKVSWQVGPQVRYQLLSSFINKYPVKENLFDFGLKVGVTLNNHQ